jgi:hypothetical protein
LRAILPFDDKFDDNLGAALAQGPQLTQPCPNVDRLQGFSLRLPMRARRSADTRFRDVVKPIRQVFGDRQSRCRNRYPAPTGIKIAVSPY